MKTALIAVTKDARALSEVSEAKRIGRASRQGIHVKKAWVCTHDKAQRGSFEAYSAGCDGVVSMQSNALTPLEGKCTVEFNVAMVRRQTAVLRS